MHGVKNSAVQMTLPASTSFAHVFAAAIRALCERMRWPTENTTELINVATESFDLIAQDTSCEEINASLTVIDGGLQVQIYTDCDLPTSVGEVVQASAADLDRVEIDAAARMMTLSKNPTP